MRVRLISASSSSDTLEMIMDPRTDPVLTESDAKQQAEVTPLPVKKDEGASILF